MVFNLFELYLMVNNFNRWSIEIIFNSIIVCYMYIIVSLCISYDTKNYIIDFNKEN
jgi:hypothetical protein